MRFTAIYICIAIVIDSICDASSDRRDFAYFINIAAGNIIYIFSTCR